MEPRIIIKTHIGALKPSNYSLLIGKCTYPDKSAYPETIIKRLQELINNKSVAKYTVLLSTIKNRGFGFLRDNMIWTWKGHVINTVLIYTNKKEKKDPIDFELSTKIEKVCYLRYFLETEGAFILKIAQIFNEFGELPYSYLENHFQKILIEIIDEYLSLAPDLRSRIRIKKIYSLMKTKEEYDSGTIPHKIKPHMEALMDLGLIEFISNDHKQVYIPKKPEGVRLFSIIQDVIPNIYSMEKLFEYYAYFSLIKSIYDNTHNDYSTHYENLIKDTLIYGYEIMRDKLTGMADINALIDWCCIKMLSEDNVFIKKKDIHDFLNKIRKENPTKIIFHVDGKGNIAYLIIKDSL